MLESVYEIVLAYELQQRRFSVERQVPIAICYKGMTFAEAFRADIVVDKKVIVELNQWNKLAKRTKGKFSAICD